MGGQTRGGPDFLAHVLPPSASNLDLGSSLYILEIRPLFDVGLVKILSLSVGCPFVLMTVSFVLQKLLSFRRSHVFIIALIVCLLRFYLGSGLLCPVLQNSTGLSLSTYTVTHLQASLLPHDLSMLNHYHLGDS